MEGIQYGIQQGYNPMTAAYASQPYASQLGQPREYGQQGLFGAAGNPLSGLIGSGIPGLLSGQNFGRQPGQLTDGIGGMFQSYGNPYGNIDPTIATHIQQSQLGQQAQLAQLIQQAQVAQQLAQQQLGRSPFGQDPISAAIAQQRAQFGQQAQFAPWQGVNPLNRIDPITAAYIQQAQIAQQLALQGQLGQQNQFGHQFGQGQFGQSHFGQGQFDFGQQGQGQLGFVGGGLNPWASLQLAAQYGRTLPWQYGPIGIGGYGGQLPIH